MNKQTIITALLALITLAGQAQEERTDTVVPKFLINGYFFREMPKLPDATPSMTPLKDKEGNRIIAIGLNVDLCNTITAIHMKVEIHYYAQPSSRIST